jgi:hypothetical protein
MQSFIDGTIRELGLEITPESLFPGDGMLDSMTHHFFDSPEKSAGVCIAAWLAAGILTGAFNKVSQYFACLTFF